MKHFPNPFNCQKETLQFSINKVNSFVFLIYSFCLLFIFSLSFSPITQILLQKLHETPSRHSVKIWSIFAGMHLVSEVIGYYPIYWDYDSPQNPLSDAFPCSWQQLVEQWSFFFWLKARIVCFSIVVIVDIFCNISGHLRCLMRLYWEFCLCLWNSEHNVETNLIF